MSFIILSSRCFSLLVLLMQLVWIAAGAGEELISYVHCDTTKGPLTIEVHPSWAPLGAERFLALINDNFFTDIAFFRCVKGFLTQFGISDQPSKKHWHREKILDDPNIGMGIKKNYVSFAGGGPNTRSTQIFIAFEDLGFLGKEPWETPFGIVIEGQQTLNHLYKGYGDIPPFGEGPDQQEIFRQGNQYVRDIYPKVDFIQSCFLSDAQGQKLSEALPPEDDASVISGRGHEVTPDELSQSLDKVKVSSNEQRKQPDRLDSFAEAMEGEEKEHSADDDKARKAFQQQLLVDDIARKEAADDVVSAEASRDNQLRGSVSSEGIERNSTLIFRALGLMLVFVIIIFCFVSFGKRSSKAQ